ncbi:MAG TPA: YkgJ family cysteine cluster protein [Vicinamibacteria bacterium]|jgi:Fe-S-cluster containining protein
MIALPLAAPPLVPCTQCAKCCTYVAVGINAPRGVRGVTEILWYLYHDGVSVYRDGSGEWSVVFATRCRHLQDDLLCGIYERRPHVCRTFDNTTCEVNSEGGTSFETPGAFLEWVRRRRPRLFRSLPAHLPAPAALAR